MSPCVPQHTRESTQLSLQMFITVNHWSGWRPLASDALLVLAPPWDSSQIACCCFVSWSPAALLLQDLPLHMLQQMTRMLARVGQLKALDGIWVGQLTCSPVPEPARASSPTHCCALGAGSTVLPRQGASYSPKCYNLQGAEPVLLHPSHHIAGESQG